MAFEAKGGPPAVFGPIPAVSEELGIPKRLLRRWVRDAVVDGYQVSPGKVLVDRGQVAAEIRRRRVPPSEPLAPARGNALERVRQRLAEERAEAR